MHIDNAARLNRGLALPVVVALTLAACVAVRPATAQSGAVPRAAATVSAYYPERGNAWQRRRPADAGMDSAAVGAAVSFAQTNEIGWSRDMAEQMRQTTAREPYPEIIGPLKDRGSQNGMIIRHGYIVAEWGDTERVDMTFSVAKSYLSTVAGLAFDRGLIRNMDEPVAKSVRDGGYDSPHNASITWHQTFNQTSEWEGTL